MGTEFKTVNEYVIKYGGDMATRRILGDCACNHGNDAKALWKEFADYLGIYGRKLTAPYFPKLR